MSAAYSLVFLVLASIASLVAVVAWDPLGFLSLLPAYAAVSLLTLAAAYAGCGPRLLGKRHDGRRSISALLLLGPYFLLNAFASFLHRNLSREPAYAEVVPGLFFGRRLTDREAASHLGWTSVLDLAPEFPEASTLRSLPGYRSLPLLDATAPTHAQIRDAVEWLTRRLKTGPVYVHCALGHGRTGCVLAAYLLSAGHAKSVGEALRMMRALRPGVGLNRPQRRALRALEARHERGA